MQAVEETNIPAGTGPADATLKMGLREAFCDRKKHLRAAIYVAYSRWSEFPIRKTAIEPGGIVKANIQYGVAAASVALICLGISACGSSVSGHTYSAPGGMVKIEFQSGGKAMTSMGPMSSSCTYTQSGAKVELTCEGDTTELTVASDGSLNGPPDGMLGKLTKVN
jgi:hypothetical protein